ncbi:MAG: diadenylate cyclase CdaA [Bacteroidia bacterium]|nr:diadenylate cyclase CdaA [Bacteroidia bacterium]
MITTFLTVRFLDVLDVLLVAFLFYQMYMLIRQTVAIKIFFGIVSVYLLWLLVKALKMELLGSILGQLTGVGVIAVIIVFQQEIRRGLLFIGSRQLTGRRLSVFRFFFGDTQSAEDVRIDSIIIACRNMSNSKTGALLVIQKSVKLDTWLTIKDVLDAETSSRLIISIFFKNSPLHDGAVIISGSRIYAARCVLPLSEKSLPPNLGMRHRAAVGITEVTDAVVVVISEETGSISFVKNGDINYNIDHRQLSILLGNEFSAKSK